MIVEYELVKKELLTDSERAQLKRCLGKRLAESGRVMSLFYRVKPREVTQWQEERFFTCLTMECLWKSTERALVIPFEECLLRLADRPNENKIESGLDRRVAALLDVDWSDDDMLLATKIGRLARMLKASGEGYSPNFVALYRDLLNWNSIDRYVQRKWSRIYFLNTKQEENKNVI